MGTAEALEAVPVGKEVTAMAKGVEARVVEEQGVAMVVVRDVATAAGMAVGTAVEVV